MRIEALACYRLCKMKLKVKISQKKINNKIATSTLIIICLMTDSRNLLVI